MTPAKDILDRLDDVGVLGDFQGFVGREQPSPDEAVTIYDTTGTTPTQYDKKDERPACQVRVRAGSYDYPAAYEKIKEIRDYLATASFEISDYNYKTYIQNEPYFLEYDDNDRPIFTMNINIIREVIDNE